ncbi:ankyrin repeat-containing domain protein [Trichophaea hybrida]|nr:ankyrin repeat-containing domain protein [Trichophaea hybrida]
MLLSDLPSDLLHELVDNLSDPYDIKSFTLVNRRLHTIISPIFSHLFSHISAHIHDYRTKTSSTGPPIPPPPPPSPALPPSSSTSNIVTLPSSPEGRYHALRGEISILVEAAERGNTDLVRFLFDQLSTDVECWSSGRTAIQAACRYGHTEIVSLLLDHGADYDGPCSDTGRKVLSWAVWGGWKDIVELLLKAGAMAETYCPNRSQESTIHFAAKAFDTELLKLLLGYGHRPGCTDGNGDSSLMLSMRDGEDGMTLEVYEEGIQVLLEDGVDADCPNRNDETPMHKAAKNGLMLLVRLLLEHGANPTRDGTLPMDLARGNGWEEVTMILENAARSRGAYITEG